MKKLIYLFTASIICLGYFSCSSENDLNIEDPKSNSAFKIADPDVGTAKNLYIAMMATTEYANFKSAIAAYNTKLKKSNRGINFETKSEWMDWIDNNIGATDFSDKVEFETMFDDIDVKAKALINKNEDLFAYIADADKKQIAAIVKPGRDTMYVTIIGAVTTSSGCEDNCMDAADTAFATADEQFNYLMDEHSSAYYDAGSSLTIWWAAERWRDMEYECIGWEFHSCMCDCQNCL